MRSYVLLIFDSNQLLQRISDFQKLYEPEMDLHIARWGYPRSKNQWYKEIHVLENYVINRKKHFDKSIKHLK